VVGPGRSQPKEKKASVELQATRSERSHNIVGGLEKRGQEKERDVGICPTENYLENSS